jgi:alpha-tubulin suppressor-like RCC1 family protein
VWTNNPADTRTPIPTTVQTSSGPLSNIRQVSAGPTFGCALATDGKLWCWGDNFAGKLGDGTGIGRATAAPVNLTCP